MGLRGGISGWVFAGVALLALQAVCVAQTSSRAAARHPEADRFVAWHDAATGVSLRYPARWNVDSAQGYSDDPLLRSSVGGDVRILVPVFARGWWFPVPSQSGGDPFVESRAFSFALLPETTDPGCATHFAAAADSGVAADVATFHGMHYAHVVSSNDGAGHSWKYDLYTTFHKRQCLGFSVRQSTDHPDEVPTFTAAQAAVPRDPMEIMRSVRIQ
jgi:hypothetical protein